MNCPADLEDRMASRPLVKKSISTHSLSTHEDLSVLVVDDEQVMLTSVEIVLRRSGLKKITTCSNAQDFHNIIEREEFDLLLLDLAMPVVSGADILALVKKEYPFLPVIILTGTDDLYTAVECMKNGAFDYLTKPVDSNRLIASAARALEVSSLRRENMKLSRCVMTDKLAKPHFFADIITRDTKMFSIMKYCEAIADSSQPVLVTGETGVGKGEIVKALARLGTPDGPLVAVNVAGLDEQVFTDTLFGHIKGAFTDARHDRTGLVAKAAGGTLFLDEIGELDGSSQVKLLRLLEEREYYPLGADQPRKSSARVIVATQQHPDELLGKEVLRKDLYYRLRTHHIHIPPLRERKKDVLPLMYHFLRQAAHEIGVITPHPGKGVLDLLLGYDFPGNIRELKGLVFDAVSVHRERELSLEFFQENLPGLEKKTDRAQWPDNATAWDDARGQLPTIQEATEQLIQEALRRNNNIQRQAARQLGITPQALNQRLKRHEAGQ